VVAGAELAGADVGATTDVVGATEAEVAGAEVAGAEVAGAVVADLEAEARRSGQTFGSSVRVVWTSAAEQVVITQGVAFLVMAAWLEAEQIQV